MLTMKDVSRLYVCELEDSLQAKIRRSLTSTLVLDGHRGEDLRDLVQRGMESKVCYLEDTINVKRLLK